MPRSKKILKIRLKLHLEKGNLFEKVELLFSKETLLKEG